MTTQITIHPEPQNLSPYQQKQGTFSSPEVANDEFFGGIGFSFKSFLDTINPLQHIPIVSTIYCELTGDKISSGARIVGDTLFGGGIGAISAIINEITAEATGQDIGAHLFAAATGKYNKTQA